MKPFKIMEHDRFDTGSLYKRNVLRVFSQHIVLKLGRVFNCFLDGFGFGLGFLASRATGLIMLTVFISVLEKCKKL